MSFAAVSLAYTFEFGGAHENALGAAYFARMSVIPYFWLFAFGVLFRLYVEEAEPQRLLPWVTFSIFAAIAIATGLSLSDWKYHPQWYDPVKMLALGCMTLFLGLSPALRSNWLARNDLSYGIYLWHMLFAHIAISFGYKGAIWTLPATVVLSFGIAWLSMKFIEQPAIAWRKRRSQLRTGATVGTPNLHNYSQSFQS